MSLINTLPSSLRLHRLTPADVSGLHHVQIACYGDGFLESTDVFTRRLASEHQCSVGLTGADGKTLQAYAVAYWSVPGKVTPLHGDFEPPEEDGRVLYIHDMCVHPLHSGKGIARHMLQLLFAHAHERGVMQVALVSVQGSQAYWERQGFRQVALADPVQRKKLLTYGDAAVYMVASLAAAWQGW